MTILKYIGQTLQEIASRRLYEAQVNARTLLLDFIIVIYSTCGDQTLLEVYGRTLGQVCGNVGFSMYSDVID